MRQNLRAATNQKLATGDYVSLRVQHPIKLSSKWDPGYQVVYVCGLAITICDLATNKELVVNRQHVRLLPNRLAHKLVEPSPVRKRKGAAEYPSSPHRLSEMGTWKAVRSGPDQPPGLTARRIASTAVRKSWSKPGLSEQQEQHRPSVRSRTTQVWP